MRLCFILNHLYKPGGIERVVSNRLSELSKEHDVYVLTTENGQLPFYFGKDEICCQLKSENQNSGSGIGHNQRNGQKKS